MQTQHRVGIAVDVEEDLKGFSGSIAGMEKLEDKVVGLRKEEVSLRKELDANHRAIIELDKAVKAGTVSNAEAGRMAQQLATRNREISDSLKLKSTSLRTAQAELRAFGQASRNATQDVQLLGAAVGVQIPAQFQQLISRIPGVQNAVGKAFNAGVLVAFGVAGGQALAHIIVAATQFNLHSVWGQIKQTLTDVFSPIDAARRNLILANKEAASNKRADAVLGSLDRQREIERATATVGLSGVGLLRVQRQQAIDDVQRRVDREALPPSVAAKEIEAITAKFAAQIAQEMEKAAEQFKKRLEAIDQRQEQLFSQEAAQSAVERRVLVGPGIQQAEITAGLGAVPQQAIVDASARVAQIRKAQAEILKIEEDANIARLQGHERTLAEIDRRERESLRDFEHLRDGSLAGEEDYQRARVALAEQAEAERMDVARRAYEEERQRQQELGRDLESFYDRTIGSARNAKEALANIWREMAQDAKHLFFQQLAGWLRGGSVGGALGGSAASGAGAAVGSGGGLFGSILGGVFGGGGAMGGGGTFGSGPVNGDPRVLSFAGAGASRSFAPLGTLGNFSSIAASPAASIGFGAVAERVQPTAAATLGLPAAAAPATFGGSLSAFLGRGSRMQGAQTAALGAAIAFQGFQLNNPTARFFMTAGGAALTGASIGMMVGGPMGAAIGAGIGFIAGGIASLFGKDKKKMHDADVANQGFAALRLVKEDYERHRRDYGSTVDAMDQIWQQMSANFQRRQSQDQRRWYDIMRAQVAQIEDERIRRRNFMGSLALPEFEQGGYVRGGDGTSALPLSAGALPLGFERAKRFAQGGEVPAILHEGEFVMRRAAVDRIGVDRLQEMNGRGAAAGNVQRFAEGGSVESIGRLLGFRAWGTTFQAPRTATMAEPAHAARVATPAADDEPGYVAKVWFPSKAMKAEIVREGIPIVLAEGGKASKILRGV